MFLILALPRSRTAWLANWLSFGPVVCGHELLAECGNPLELPGVIAAQGARHCGSAETGASPWARQITNINRNLRLVCVFRPMREVKASLRRLNLPDCVEPLQQALEEACAFPQSLTVSFADLDSEQTARRILGHITNGRVPFDERRWRRLLHYRVEITHKRIRDLRRINDITREI